MRPLPPFALPLMIGWAVLLVVAMLVAGWRGGVLRRAAWMSALVAAWMAVLIGGMATFGVPSLWVFFVLLYGGMSAWAWSTWPQWGPIFGFKPRMRAADRAVESVRD
jgi:hypothetical protein